MECKKCPYFDSKREMAAGKVLTGYCKLRGKYMSDTTKNKELCKDRAVVDIPASAKPVAIKPEPSLYTPKEKEQVEKAMQKPAEKPSPTFAEMAAKKGLANPSTLENTSQKASPPVRTLMLPPKTSIQPDNAGNQAGLSRNRPLMPPQKAGASQKFRQEKRRAQPEKPKAPAQVVPPMKMTPEEAMKLLDQQLSGKINAKFSKGGNEAATNSEKEVIRRAVWGG